jgi:hypothetical protein
LALVRVVEAVLRVAGAGDTEREQHLPPVPRPEPLPGVGAQTEGEKKEDSFISRGKSNRKKSSLYVCDHDALQKS